MLWTQSCILRYVIFTIQSIIWQAFHVSLQNMVLKPASRKLYGTGALKTNDNHHKTQTPQNAQHCFLPFDIRSLIQGKSRNIRAFIAKACQLSFSVHIHDKGQAVTRHSKFQESENQPGQLSSLEIWFCLAQWKICDIGILINIKSICQF